MLGLSDLYERSTLVEYFCQYLSIDCVESSCLSHGFRTLSTPDGQGLKREAYSRGGAGCSLKCRSLEDRIVSNPHDLTRTVGRGRQCMRLSLRLPSSFPSTAAAADL